MADAPAFFVPASTPENQEEHYAGLAKMAGRSVPPAVGSRIYSIRYKHNGEEWTATVGETLSGKRYVRPRGPRSSTEVPQVEQLSDPATVLAIFDGSPHVVITDHRIAHAHSSWENPFYIGRPSTLAVVRFSLGPSAGPPRDEERP
jgi:hypothetical protein